MVRVSKHASRRLKERCGLNKKSVQRMADIAFTNGMKQEDATGQLNRWMASLYGIVSDDTCPMTKEVFRKLFNNE